MSSFNISDLPIFLVEKVLKEVDAKTILNLSSVLKWPFVKKPHQNASLTIKKQAQIWVGNINKMWESMDPVTEVLARYQQLLKTFEAPIDTLEIDPRLCAQLLENENFPLSCYELRVVSKEEFYLEDEREEAVNRLLGKMDMKLLYLDVEGCYISNLRALSVDELVIESGNWMAPSDTLKFDNKLLHIVTNDLEEDAINLFLLKWYNGGNNRLEVALFEEGYPGKWDMSKVLNGIPTFQFDPKNRDRYYFRKGEIPEYLGESGPVYLEALWSGVDLRNATDIRRADGTWASVEADDPTNQLRFFVWKDPHPSELILRVIRKDPHVLLTNIHWRKKFAKAEERSVEERAAIDKDVQRLRELYNECAVLIHVLESCTDLF